MPTTIVSMVFFRHQAIKAATSAATSLALSGVRRSVPGVMNTTAGIDDCRQHGDRDVA